MFKRIPELFLIFPSVYSILKLIKQPNFADSLIVGFLGLIAVALFHIRFKTESQAPVRPEEIIDLQNELEKERIKISMEELRFQAGKNRVMRDAMESGTAQPNKRFSF